MNLSGTSAVTVEFWLKWDGFVDDDQLAMELTDNFNANNGGFLIDPNASNGSFGVAIGNDGGRNNVYFARPSAGQWHHYAFVLDTERAGRHAGRAVRRRRAGGLHQGRERHRRGELRQRPTALHVARRGRACSAAATSTRWLSTTAPSARARSPRTAPRAHPERLK